MNSRVSPYSAIGPRSRQITLENTKLHIMIVGLGWSIKFSLFMLNWIQVKAIVHGMQAAGKNFSAATAIQHLVTLNGI